MTNHPLRTCVFLLVTLVAVPAAAAGTPRIDFGRHFHVRLHNQTDSSRDPAVGQSKVLLVATILDAKGDLVVTARQAGKEVTRFRCPVKPRGVTRCESEYLDAKRIAVARPLEIAATFADEVSDAETVLYAGSFPVLGFHDWSGDRKGKPHHVEQRALVLDSALGGVIAQQAAFGSSNAGGVQTVPSSEVGFMFWEARAEQRKGKSTLRCRVDGGDWQGMRMSGPGNEGESQELRNRVKVRGDVVDQRLDYQQIRVVATMPFWVQGADQELTSPPPEANGAWLCQLRDADKQVWREFHFTVAGGALQPHPAQAALPGLTIEPGRALIAVAFAAETTPASFDPAEVRRAFFGLPWPGPDAAPVTGALPPRKRPELAAPRR